MKTITLPPEEARNLIKVEKGKPFWFMRPLDEQPTNEHTLYEHMSDSKYRTHVCFNKLESCVYIPLQYPVGAKLGVRETWTIYQTLDSYKKIDGRLITEWSDGLYAYKSDGFEDIADFKEHIKVVAGSDFIEIQVLDNKWHSGATMPEDAIRKHLLIVSNVVKRVQVLTTSEMDRLYTEYEATTDKFQFFDDWFNSLYGKPRKKGDGFACYPYSEESFWDSKYSDDVVPYKGKTYEYKGKPLIICYNSYMEFVEAEVV